MRRHVLGRVRKEDLVALFHLLLAPAHGNRLEVEAYRPELLARGRLSANGRDEKVIMLIEKSPIPQWAAKKVSAFFSVFFVATSAKKQSMTPEYLILSHLRVEAEFGEVVAVV
jgi:hypothetical protein